MHAILALLRADGLRLIRDRFLMGGALYLLAAAAGMRLAVPWLRAELAPRGLDLDRYAPLIGSGFALVNTTVLMALIGGFLLLETKEERTLAALRISPLAPRVQLLAWGAATGVVGAALAVGLAALLGVGWPGWGPMVGAAALTAPVGVATALVLAAFAANKVEAFALMKATSLLGLLPLVAWFVPGGWQWCFAVVPTFWPCKLWWLAASGQPWAWALLPGLLVAGIWVAVPARRFARTA